MSANTGVYDEVAGMKAQYQLGGLDSLAVYAEKLLQKWGAEYLSPERVRGESQKKYDERVAKVAREHYQRMVRKIQGMITQATVGASASLQARGIALKDGANITLKGRPVVNAGGNKQDWTLPVAAFHTSIVG
jgi:hypothetical protein